MNFKLKGNYLLNADIVYPETIYATFSKELTPVAAKELVLNLNYGHDLLMVYKQFRDNLHITNVVEMLKRMDALLREYDYKVYEARHRIDAIDAGA